MASVPRRDKARLDTSGGGEERFIGHATRRRDVVADSGPRGPPATVLLPGTHSHSAAQPQPRLVATRADAASDSVHGSGKTQPDY
ncbi:unnamed protein product [Lampetra planeri]